MSSMLARDRIEAGITQWELAAKAGVSLRTVRRAETGRSVSRATTLRMEEALGRELEARHGPVLKAQPSEGETFLFRAWHPMSELRVGRHDGAWAVWSPSYPTTLCRDGYLRNIIRKKVDRSMLFGSFAQALSAACIHAEMFKVMNSPENVEAFRILEPFITLRSERRGEWERHRDSGDPVEWEWDTDAELDRLGLSRMRSWAGPKTPADAGR